MRNSLARAALAALLFFCGGLCAGAQTTQTETLPRYEIGGQFYTVGSGSNSNLGVGGAGGRFTYNFNKYLALDSELNIMFEADDDNFVVNGVHAFSGLKAGVRNRHVGVFVKARPGFTTNFHRAIGGSLFNSERIVTPAFDLGGVLEVYLKRSVALRFDAGDVIIPFGNDQIEEVRCPCPRRLGTTHNFGSSIGVNIRF
jgi:hypothetical protein